MASQGDSSAGTCVFFAATLPATYDQAGYEALTYIPWVENTNIGEFGPSFSVLSYNTMCDGAKNKRTGTVDYGDLSFEGAYVTTDVGQAVLEAAANARSVITVKIESPDGEVVYSTGVVSTATTMIGGPEDIKMFKGTMNITTKFERIVP